MEVPVIHGMAAVVTMRMSRGRARRSERAWRSGERGRRGGVEGAERRGASARRAQARPARAGGMGGGFAEAGKAWRMMGMPRASKAAERRD